jgi:hypothetical protein
MKKWSALDLPKLAASNPGRNPQDFAYETGNSVQAN